MSGAPANRNRLLYTPGWLAERYVDRRLPVEEIAAEAECDAATVHRARNHLGIPTRGKATASRASWGEILTRERLTADVEAGLTAGQIAAAVGCDHGTVVWWLAKHQLLAVNDAQAEDLKRLYVEDDLSLRAIAERTGRSTRNIAVVLMATGVDLYAPGHPFEGGEADE